MSEVDAVVKGFIEECTDVMLREAAECISCTLPKPEKLVCMQQGMTDTILSYHDRWNQATEIDRALPRDLFLVGFCANQLAALEQCDVSEETRVTVRRAISEAVRQANHKRGN